MWESSKIVPMVTVNWPPHGLHWNTPGRCALPCNRVTFSTAPQCGQTGPFGQRMRSSVSRASSSVRAETLLRVSIAAGFRIVRPADNTDLTGLCQVHNYGFVREWRSAEPVLSPLQVETWLSRSPVSNQKLGYPLVPHG